MRAPSPALVHCGYHKCLTVFFNRCFMHVLGDRYHNFHGGWSRFYEQYSRYTVSATSDFCLDLSKLADYRVSRFIRDPRDLIVSGYFYHRKGPEPWTNRLEHPESWRKNGGMPSALHQGESYATLLQRLDQEDGLIAELELRAPHLQSMRQWPADDSRIRVWKYEDILGDEERVMAEVATHYGWPETHEFRAALRYEAGRWRAGEGRLSWDGHVRDPRSGQWKELFSPRVHRVFTERFGDLAEELGYD